MSQQALSAKDANATLDLIHTTLQCNQPHDFLTLFECLKQLLGFDQPQCIYGNSGRLAAGEPDSLLQQHSGRHRRLHRTGVSGYPAAELPPVLPDNSTVPFPSMPTPFRAADRILLGSSPGLSEAARVAQY